MFPEGPVVPAFRTPIVEMMWNSFVRQNIRKPVGRATVFPRAGACGDVDVALCELRHHVSIGEVRKVVDRIVEVSVVVVHSAHEILYVVNAGKSETATHNIGMFEQCVCRVVSAERRTHGGNRDVLRPAIVANKRNYFITHVSVELRLNPTAMKRVRALVIESRGIYGVDAEKLHAPGVDQGRQTPNQSLVSKLPLVACAGGKSEKRRPPVPIYDDPHIQAQAIRIPPVIFPFHVAPAVEWRLVFQGQGGEGGFIAVYGGDS